MFIIQAGRSMRTDRTRSTIPSILQTTGYYPFEGSRLMPELLANLGATDKTDQNPDRKEGKIYTIGRMERGRG